MKSRTPVVVGAAQLSGRDGDNEPIEMMHHAAATALSQGWPELDQIRVVKGIWPYADPGPLIAQRLGVEVPTGLTQLGGNEAYDLLNASCAQIVAGELDAVLLCSAETMRTRRRDRKAGRRSAYLDEADGAIPDHSFGSDIEFWEEADFRTWNQDAVNFYAMSASAIRHRRGLTPEQYLQRTAELWAGASVVASGNSDAWIREPATAKEIATTSPGNRMVADPFPKLLTSNINVDQAAAVVVCSVAAARTAGIDPGSWIFPLAGSGAYDPLLARTRDSFSRSPSMRIAGSHALQLAGLSIEGVDLVDLYSCFPSAVQVAQEELGLDEQRSFTITGGMTFFGGPFNSYCMHALARAVELLQNDPGTAFLSGNGGWLTKHSFSVLGSSPPDEPFRYERPQAVVDAEPQRPMMSDAPAEAVIDAYSVRYDRDGDMEKAMIAVADQSGARAWALSTDPDTMQALVEADSVGTTIAVDGTLPVLDALLT